MGNDAQDNESKEVKPVKLSVGATIALVFGAAICIAIFFLTLRGCSVQKSTNSGQNVQSTKPPVVESTQTPTNGETIPTKPVQNTPEIEGTIPSATEFTEPENKGNSNSEQSVNPTSPDFEEVADAVLSELRTASGMVIGKHVYKYEDSYIYGVSVSIIVGENTTVSAQYFCPRKSFDSLSSGEPIKVSYQVDSNGQVSIYSISKG